MLSNKPFSASLARLTDTTWDELWTRARQEVLKRWDTGLYRAGIRRDINRSPIWPHQVKSQVPNESQGHFFWSPSDLPRVLALMQEKLPLEVGKTLDEAERICRHQVDLLGYRGIDFGPEIDWHSDRIHEKRAPRKSWYKVHYLDFDEVGDHKIIWELNRHQHLVILAKAWCFAHEERYVSELLREWYDWQRENPYPIGINWASSLEVGFRALSWLWVWHLLADCPLVTEGFRRDLLCALALNGRHIELYLSTYFSPNTHLLGEAAALFFIGTLCPQLAHARSWQKRGWEIVLQETERQIQPDGMHFEQSVYYHVYALDFCLHVRVLAACNGFRIPAAFDQTIEKMLEVLCTLGQAGPPPRLGDDDGGRVFNPRRNRAEHMLDPLATGAAIFGRSDFKAVAGDLREETLWLLGPKGAADFEASPHAKSGLSSVRFQPSGICVMAGEGPQELVIDGGPQGNGTAGHGHADALSVCISANGREWLADAGTFTYASTGSGRDSFRGTAAHNTLRIDGLSQADPDGSFAWRTLPKVQVDRWTSGETFDLFEGSHTGYCRLPDPVVHRRWVFYLKPLFWFVRDLAEGKKVHQLDLFWHLGRGTISRSDVASDSIVFAIDQAEGKEGLALIPVRGHGWSREFSQCGLSPVYGIEEPTTVLRFSTRTALPAEFAAVLLSSARVRDEAGVLTEIQQEGSSARGYCYSDMKAIHLLFFAEGEKNWKLGQWESDAQFLYCETTPEGERHHFVLCEGSNVSIDGKHVVAFKHPVARFEWAASGGVGKIFCSEPLREGNGKGFFCSLSV